MSAEPRPQFNFKYPVTIASVQSHASELSAWGQRGWARVAELEDENTALRAHRCEVGLENPDAMLAHLQSLSPEDKAELENLMTRKRR